MNIARERRAIDAALDTYRQLLDTYSDDQFTVTPPMGGWSYAEVYDHIMKASLGSAIAMERCTHNNCPPTSKGPTLIGWYILLTGTLPPIKTKLPDAVAAKVQPNKIDKEQAKNLIIKLRKRLDTITNLINNAPQSARWQHPRMGMLNAGQWLKFIRIHLLHHLKQLNRIKNNFVR
jgi:hypothetical protein